MTLANLLGLSLEKFEPDAASISHDFASAELKKFIVEIAFRNPAFAHQFTDA